MNRAVDFANYTGIPTSNQVRCWLDAGYTKTIIGTSFGSVWQQQISACQAGGMDVEQYVFPGRHPRGAWPYWIDCETPEATQAAIRTLAPAAKGIYTRRGWWTGEMGDWNIVAEFPHLKLWEAHYGDPPPIFVPFGGFTSRAIIQWHDSTTLCGLNVDLNIIEEEDEMTPAQMQELKNYMDTKFIQLIGWVNAQGFVKKGG